MKPILFDPDRHSDRIQYTADCPAAIVSEVCGQLMAGALNVNDLVEVLETSGLLEGCDDGRRVVKAILAMLTELGFVKFPIGTGNAYQVVRPMSISESFTAYFEDKYSEEEIDD